MPKRANRNSRTVVLPIAYRGAGKRKSDVGAVVRESGLIQRANADVSAPCVRDMAAVFEHNERTFGESGRVVVSGTSRVCIPYAFVTRFAEFYEQWKHPDQGWGAHTLEAEVDLKSELCFRKEVETNSMPFGTTEIHEDEADLAAEMW